MGIGATELIWIFLIILLLFGAKKLPELAQGLGKGIREFKKAAKDADEVTRLEDQRREKEENKTE